MSFDPRHTITVIGTGTATAVPDVARLRIAVEQTRTLIGDALAAAATDAATVARLAREAQLADGDIASGRLSLNQVYGDDHRDVRGYSARQSFTLTVRSLDAVGPLVTRLGQEIGTALRIDDLTVDIGEPAPLAVRARERAMEAARKQAQALAALAGRELGQVIVIDTEAESERFDMGGSPRMMMAASFSPEAGERDIAATIRVTYELI